MKVNIWGGSDSNSIYIQSTASGCNDQGVISAGSGIASTYTITLDTWYHLAVTVGGGNGFIYINALQVGNSSTMTNATNITRTGYFGYHPHGYYANALIDEIKFYNRALSAAEVLTDKNTNGPIM
jgi:hypothetical protein